MDDYTNIGEKPRMGQQHGEAREQIGRIAREAKHEGSEIIDELQDYIQEFAHGGKEKFADRLHGVCESLHRAAGVLEEDHHPNTSRFTHKAADTLDRVAEYLHEHEPSDVVEDATHFARRQPITFIGGALMAGLLLGRFLRSGREHDADRSRSENPEGRSMMPAQSAPRRVEVGIGVGGSETDIRGERQGPVQRGQSEPEPSARPITGTPGTARPGSGGSFSRGPEGGD